MATRGIDRDALNRLATARTVNTSGANCWGESYSVDQWANLLMIGNAPGYATGCGYENFSFQMNNQNQISSPSGFGYDLAGNLIQTGMASYAYNAESQIAVATTGSATNYVYDGDGNRVEKVANGQATKLYWYTGSEVLDETDGTGAKN